MRRTKIIATLGPATDSPGVLAELIDAGADVVRINCSHGSWEDRARQIALVRELSAAAGKYVAVLGDLPLPVIQGMQKVTAPVTVSKLQRA